MYEVFCVEKIIRSIFTKKLVKGYQNALLINNNHIKITSVGYLRHTLKYENLSKIFVLVFYNFAFRIISAVYFVRDRYFCKIKYGVY